MRRHVLFACPLGQIRHVHVCVGALTIEAATGLRTEDVALLDEDDRQAIEKAMRK